MRIVSGLELRKQLIDTLFIVFDANGAWGVQASQRVRCAVLPALAAVSTSVVGRRGWRLRVAESPASAPGLTMPLPYLCPLPPATGPSRRCR